MLAEAQRLTSTLAQWTYLTPKATYRVFHNNELKIWCAWCWPKDQDKPLYLGEYPILYAAERACQTFHRRRFD